MKAGDRLATEALPFFSTAHAKVGLQTTGFKRRKRRDEFTWPIWEPFIGFASARSLMSLAEMQKDAESQRDGESKRDAFKREALLAMGIKEIYRAQRVRIGEGANFKVSFRPARTL